MEATVRSCCSLCGTDERYSSGNNNFSFVWLKRLLLIRFQAIDAAINRKIEPMMQNFRNKRYNMRIVSCCTSRNIEPYGLYQNLDEKTYDQDFNSQIRCLYVLIQDMLARRRFQLTDWI